jgi:L-seryl-tRNA(Ser) seleniumtransferase
MTSVETDVYEEIGVQSIINAAGTKTRVGGSRIRPEAAAAMERASQGFARIEDLQARGSEVIRELTGAEAGYITNGAASGLALGAAACLAGSDLSKMSALPDTSEMANEIVMPRTHRTTYDNAFRLAGAEITDVGGNDRELGTGAENTKLWQLEDAIGEETVAVGYIYKQYNEPSLSAVADLAHDHDVPVLVDAAAELPPVSNLSKFVDEGADLVVFSGGKAIRGPQSAGVVAGRSDLIQSIALQQTDMHVAPEMWDPPSELVDRSALRGVPNQGIGRAMKVGKEELVGMIRALELFVEEDYDARRAEWLEALESIEPVVAEADGIEAEIFQNAVSVAPYLTVTVQGEDAGTAAKRIVDELGDGDPPIVVGSDDATKGQFTINPMCLEEWEVDVLRERLADVIDA